MPKETFYNLVEEKRKRILDAASEELIRVPISKMSINKIIQGADISRGSFYQYFEDKHDLIQYMLADYIQMLKDGITYSMEVNKGDLFVSASQILATLVQLGKKEPNQKAFGNILKDVRFNDDCSLEFLMGLEKEILAIFKQKINKTLLTTTSSEDITYLARLIFSMLNDAVGRCFHNINDEEIIQKGFRRQLEFVKQGVEKEKNPCQNLA